MSNILTSMLMPLVVAFGLGYLLARFSPWPLRTYTDRLFPLLVWLLLMAIGFDFGETFRDISVLYGSLQIALIFSLVTSATIFVLIWLVDLFFLRNAKATLQDNEAKTAPEEPASILRIVMECLMTIGAVAVGALLFFALSPFYDLSNLSFSMPLLQIMLVFIGIDMTAVRINRSWFSIQSLSLPILVIIGSLLGAVLASFLTQVPVNVALSIASGMGWYSLSGIMIGQHFGEHYGSIALMTDLLRELVCLLVLTIIGRQVARPSIGTGGATTMDMTLPMIKQYCGTSYVPLALLNGLLLTLIVPFLVSLMFLIS